MTLQGSFVLYLAVLHAVFVAVTAVLLTRERLWLLAVEALYVVSFLVGSRLVRRLAEPARVIQESVELVASGDTTTRLRDVEHPEVRELIRVYNRMAESLRSERVRNEEQEGALRRIVEASPTGIVFCDWDGRVVAINPAAATLLEVDAADALGRPVADVASPIAREIATLAEGASKLVHPTGHRRFLCRRLHFVDRGSPRTFVLIEELTAELDRSERAAYEKVIRMMAHEVHNTTAAVISLLESLAHMDLSPTADREQWAVPLEVAAARAGRLDAFMRRLADVVRVPPPRPVPCRLPDLVDGLLRLVRPQAGERDVELSVEVEDGFPELSFDPEQLEQVLLNVCKNALESIGRDGRVRIVMRRAGGRPEIAIEDSGAGIGADARDQLFSPFFTTKPDGAGVGLTLAREILQGHGFDFALENLPGGGAVFVIRF